MKSKKMGSPTNLPHFNEGLHQSVTPRLRTVYPYMTYVTQGFSPDAGASALILQPCPLRKRLPAATVREHGGRGKKG